ncbi:uncharacterized protein METZ01_LOCUS413137, partial [marine metagenome]
IQLRSITGQDHDALVPGEWVVIETTSIGFFGFLRGS